MNRFPLFIFIAISFYVSGQGTRGATVLAPKPSASTGNTYALIIGISKYQSSHIPQLNYADSDALAFRNFLVSTPGGNIPAGNVKVLLNDSARLGDIMEIGLPWLEAKAKKGDRVYIYFSGHGITIGNNDSYLLASDIKEGFNKHNIFFYGGVPILQLKRDDIQTMTSGGIEVFLIIDACRSRALENKHDSIKLFATSAMSENAGDIMLLAAENGQSSLEDDPGNKKWGGHGVFTYYLLNGLEGMADGMGGPQDGLVTLGELKNYLNNKVPEETGFVQEPFVSEGYSQVQLSKVDPATLASLKQKSQSSSPLLAFQSVSSKGVISTDDDSVAAAIYAKFVRSLKDGDLLGDSGSYKWFNRLENYPRSGNYKQDALYSLCAALQNNGQKVINVYLYSDLKNLLRNKIHNDKNIGSIFAEGERNMDSLYVLRNKYYPGNKYNQNIKACCLFMKGRMLASSTEVKKLNEAESAIKQALLIDSAQPYFYHTLGLIYANEDKNEQAIQEEKKALSLFPDWLYPYNLLGTIYYDLKKYDTAEINYQKAFHIDSTNFAVLNNIGNLYSIEKNYDKAEIYFNKVLAIDSTFTPTINNLGYLFVCCQNYPKAEYFYLKALRIDSTNTSALNNFGNLYRTEKNFNNAFQYYNRTLKIDSTNKSASYGIACCYSMHNDKQNALKFLEKSLKNGYNNYSNLTTETYLENIRTTPEFKALMKKYFPEQYKGM